MFKTFLEGQKNSRFLLCIELNLVQPGGNEICRVHILEDTACVNHIVRVRGLLEKYPTFGREKETGLPGALDT